MHIRNRPGQVLLIAVMLLATVITVVMTIAFNATTETQVARLESDSQKALAAAEAGVDAVIKQSVDSSGVKIESMGSGQFGQQVISGNAQVVGVPVPYFVTPLLQKDEQYTFYLSNYIPPTISTPIQFTNSWKGTQLDIYVASEGTGCSNLAIEVVVVKNDINNTLERYAYNSSVISNTTGEFTVLDTPVTINSTAFQCKIFTPITVAAETGKIAFIKVLGGKTKLGFKSADVPLKNLPIQGKTVESEARTTTGVVKKVELFQSYPQIPSNFFMTSF